jgi:hypothetical protein
MAFWFNHKPEEATAGRKVRQDWIAERIVAHCIRWQLKWATWMQQQSGKLSPKGRVLALLLFCLLAGGYCLFLVLSGLMR